MSDDITKKSSHLLWEFQRKLCLCVVMPAGSLEYSEWYMVLLDELKAFILSISIFDFKNENAYFIFIKKLNLSL